MQAAIFMQFLPDSPINRNDSEKEIFKKYFNDLDHNMVKRFMNNTDNENIKSENMAKKFRTKGNLLYKEKNYKNTLNMYNMSITMAPRDSVEFGLALGNRSAVFFDKEMYKECLLDIKLLLKTEYPENLRYKVFIRQSKCFVALHSYGEAMKSFKNAQANFESCKASLGRVQIDEITEKLKCIKDPIEEGIRNGESIEIEYEDKLSLPALKDGENPNFLNASKSVDLNYSEQLGRHVVANTDIKIGDALFIEEPYSFGRPLILPNIGYMQYCSQCMKRLIRKIPCTLCTIFLYCSDECRQMSWDMEHKWICLGARKNLQTEKIMLAQRILFRASHTNLNTTVPIKEVYGNKNDNYPFVDKLLTHKSDMSIYDLVEHLKEAAWLVIYLTYFTDYFDWLYVQPNRPQGSRRELIDIVGGMIFKSFLQLNCNDECIIEMRCHLLATECNVAFELYKKSRALYVSSAMLNHSCVPNAARSFHKSVKVVRAVEDIKKGTEITVSYYNFKHYIANQETSEILDRFHFKCKCYKCSPSVEQQLLVAWLCPSCKGRLLPMLNNVKFGKCYDCQLKINLHEHKHLEYKLEERAVMFIVNEDCQYLESMLKIMKKLYHKYHERFITVYYSLSAHYEITGNLKRSLEFDKILDNVLKNLIGITKSDYALQRPTLCVALAKYCKFLKFQNSSAYEKILEETKQTVKETAVLLQYFTSQDSIEEFERVITDILSCDKPIVRQIGGAFIEDL